MAGQNFMLSDELHSKINCHSNKYQFKLQVYYEHERNKEIGSLENVATKPSLQM
jgi:hypothetical protein